MSRYVIHDSGTREEFPSGMVRDRREGKGRYDLISPFALRRLAGVYERGAVKYDERNWEKGAPYCRFLDSALRHIEQYLARETDEDHLAQAAWNLFAIMHFEELGRTELDNRPGYEQRLVQEECKAQTCSAVLTVDASKLPWPSNVVTDDSPFRRMEEREKGEGR